MQIVRVSYGYLHLQKRNTTLYPGSCPLCRYTGNLASYDARFWFFVNHIPLIPLRRWHVWDRCPSCGHNQEMPLKKWDEMKVRVINEAMYVLRQDPRNRRLVFKAIETAVPYRGAAPCAELAKLIETNWFQDSEILIAVGELYTQNGLLSDAERVYRELLATSPNSEVRESLALLMVAQSRPKEAWGFLRHCIDGTWSEKIPILLSVIESCQNLGMHDEALDMLDECTRAFPEIENRPAYQACRKASEKHRPYRPRHTKPA